MQVKAHILKYCELALLGRGPPLPQFSLQHHTYRVVLRRAPTCFAGHLTEEGLEEIIVIKAGMNRGRSN